MSKFKQIGLLGKTNHIGTLETLRSLLASIPNLMVEETLAASLSTQLAAPAKTLAATCDLLIVVGGDGSLLQTAVLAAQNHTPVLGINRGHLGFLTDLYPTELTTKLKQILNGHYHEEPRFLLQTQIMHNETCHSTHVALNDVVFTSNNRVKLFEFEVFIDNELMCKHRGDGLIAATPTGSTAYALSAGGPILHPSLDAIVLVPMLPHTLTSRSIVIDSQSQIIIQSKKTACLSCDGQPIKSIQKNQWVQLQKYKHPLRLIHPVDYHYFDTLRSKLRWSTYT